MPVPAAPRRAAPPRRKTPKSPAPTPGEERVAVSDDITAPLPSADNKLDASSSVTDDGAPKTEEAEAPVSEEDKRMSMDIVTSDSESSAHVAVPTLPTSSEATEADLTDVQYNREESPTPPSPMRDDSPPSPKENFEAPTPRGSTSPHDSEVETHEGIPQATQATPSDIEDDLPAAGTVPTSDAATPSPEVSEAAADAVEDTPSAVEEEEDEQAKKKRIAERIGKTGGVNPFAPPPLRSQSSASTEATEVSPPLKRSSVSSTAPSIQRKTSTSSDVSEHTAPASPTVHKRSSISSVHSVEKRKTSIDSPLEESRPLPLPPRRNSSKSIPEAETKDGEY